MVIVKSRVAPWLSDIVLALLCMYRARWDLGEEWGVVLHSPSVLDVAGSSCTNNVYQMLCLPAYLPAHLHKDQTQSLPDI